MKEVIYIPDSLMLPKEDKMADDNDGGWYRVNQEKERLEKEVARLEALLLIKGDQIKELENHYRAKVKQLQKENKMLREELLNYV